MKTLSSYHWKLYSYLAVHYALVPSWTAEWLFLQVAVAGFPTALWGSTAPCGGQWRVNFSNRMNGCCGEQHLITQRGQQAALICQLNLFFGTLRGRRHVWICIISHHAEETLLFQTEGSRKSSRSPVFKEVSGRISSSYKWPRGLPEWTYKMSQFGEAWNRTVLQPRHTSESVGGSFCFWFVPPGRRDTGKRPHLAAVGTCRHPGGACGCFHFPFPLYYEQPSGVFIRRTHPPSVGRCSPSSSSGTS